MIRRVSKLLAAVLLGVAACAAAEPARGWFDLTPEEQQRAWDNYQQYQRMPEHQRGRIEQRQQTFQALPQEERERLRQNYDNLKGLNEEQRREFGEKYRRWKSGD